MTTEETTEAAQARYLAAAHAMQSGVAMMMNYARANYHLLLALLQGQPVGQEKQQ